ncbi:Sortase family protein [Quadrisphaera granulorum]|uniref:Sortase family protein n=1 Tax=Quadrisphaera granulorum TaxID=317664 RepID=A0A316A8A9_9ACTN|nr:sortase family protein [Quadrisphaera granulorum]SZE96422.1 Sortase family protein [Quadrisphaera granulorum]
MVCVGLLAVAGSAGAAVLSGPPPELTETAVVAGASAATSAGAAAEGGSTTAPQDSTGSADGAGSVDGADGAVPAPSAVPLAAGVTVPAPTAVRVPSLGITSDLVRLGTTADGALEVPADAAQAGWFAQGVAPGAQGPAVIAGHVDSRRGPGIFADLGSIARGAEVEVDRADGSTVRFVVTGVEQVAKDAFPTQAVYGPVAGPELRLITCGGAFDEGTGHYVDNVVVYARLAQTTTS